MNDYIEINHFYNALRYWHTDFAPRPFVTREISPGDFLYAVSVVDNREQFNLEITWIDKNGNLLLDRWRCVINQAWYNKFFQEI